MDLKLFACSCDLGNAEIAALIHGAPRDEDDVALVRLHSACLTGEVLGSMRCDCGEQLNTALEHIASAPWGILIYLVQHEGRGIGLVNKIRAYALQDKGLDTVQANEALGLPIDGRCFRGAGSVLRSLGARKVRLLTNNPEKLQTLEEVGVEVVERVPVEVEANEHSHRYLTTKRDFFGHFVQQAAENGPEVTEQPRAVPPSDDERHRKPA
jgi:GTP cyclohydrolase II